MPKIHKIRTRRDVVLFDTQTIQPNSSKTLFESTEKTVFDSAGQFNDAWTTNMLQPGILPNDQTVVIKAIGLRLVGETRDAEVPQLDHYLLDIQVNSRSQGTYVGSLCSTFKFYGDDDNSWRSTVDNNKIEHESIRRGHVLHRPLMVPVRIPFKVHVYASSKLPRAHEVRIFLFGMLIIDQG